MTVPLAGAGVDMFLPSLPAMTRAMRTTDFAVQQTVLIYLGFYALAQIVFGPLVDRWGRRPLLLIGVAAMGLGLLVLGLFFHYEITGYWPLAPLFIAVAAYNLSLAPLAWLIMSEIFPTHLRAKAMQLAAFGLWVSAFLGALGLPVMMSYFKQSFGSEAGAFWVFMAVCIFAVGFGWRMVPETKGRSLEEIGQSWTK